MLSVSGLIAKPFMSYKLVNAQNALSNTWLRVFDDVIISFSLYRNINVIFVRKHEVFYRIIRKENVFLGKFTFPCNRNSSIFFEANDFLKKLMINHKSDAN